MDRFERVYREHFSAVFRFSLSLLGRRDVAEDLTADAFLELYRRFDRIRLDELPAWLFVVVRNRARDRWRRQVVEQRHAQSIATDPSTEPQMVPPWLGNRSLAPMHRICLELHYVWGFTVPEIAERMGLTEGQIKGHLQRARLHLREAERVRTGE